MPRAAQLDSMIRLTRMPIRLILRAIGASCAMATATAFAQTTRPLVESPETHYYDFFVGDWYPEIDGRVDTTGTSFSVRRSVHPAAYTEMWVQHIDSLVLRSTALRAWDQVENRWMFTWVSDNGLYQVWRGEKIGADWYIVREFNVDGQKFLSRQAWIPEGPERLVRVLERSTDGGRSWQTRNRGTFRRVRRG